MLLSEIKIMRKNILKSVESKVDCDFVFILNKFVCDKLILKFKICLVIFGMFYSIFIIFERDNLIIICVVV